jgi:hypothetical protein
MSTVLKPIPGCAETAPWSGYSRATRHLSYDLRVYGGAFCANDRKCFARHPAAEEPAHTAPPAQGDENGE